jgi:hypothetical protein
VIQLPFVSGDQWLRSFPDTPEKDGSLARMNLNNVDSGFR